MMQYQHICPAIAKLLVKHNLTKCQPHICSFKVIACLTKLLFLACFRQQLILHHFQKTFLLIKLKPLQKILQRANCNREGEKVYVSNIFVLMKIDTCLHVLFLWLKICKIMNPFERQVECYS